MYIAYVPQIGILMQIKLLKCILIYYMILIGNM